MALGYAVALRNTRLDAITTRAGSNAVLRIYSGTRPATGGTETTILAELTCNATFAPAASSGTLTLNAITADSSANATGTASWWRLQSSGGTHVMDGDCGTSGSDMNLSTLSIVAGATVSITSAVFTAGNA